MNGRRAGIVVIAALVVLNAVLIGMLVLKSRSAPEPAATVTPTPTREQEPAPAPTTTSPPAAVPAGVLLQAVDATLAVRATVGACGRPGAVEVTADGGTTWTATANDLGPVTRLGAAAPQSFSVVGGDAECASAVTLSADGGATWGRGTAPESYWHLLPADPATIQTPTAPVPVPCAEPPVGLATDGVDNGAVLCTDGTVHASTDGGATWAVGDRLPGTLAVGAGTDGYVLGITDAGCAGVGVVRLSAEGARTGQAAACAPAAPVEPGAVAVAEAGGALWVWAGGQTLVSTDDGATW